MLYKIFKLGEVFKVVFFKHGLGGRRDDFSLEEITETENTEKLDNNLCRAKSRIRELALCNDWSHFVTLTLNGDKIDRYDLDGYVKKLGYWIGDYNKKYNTKLKYLLIPEQHKDGAWHMHGLMNGLSPNSLVKNDKGYLDMPFYSDRFGYISFSLVKNSTKIASYITKYVVKALQATAIGLCKHSFYHSQKLKGAELIHEDYTILMPNSVWSNDFVGIQMCDNHEELTKFIESMQSEEKKIEFIDSDY